MVKIFARAFSYNWKYYAAALAVFIAFWQLFSVFSAVRVADDKLQTAMRQNAAYFEKAFLKDDVFETQRIMWRVKNDNIKRILFHPIEFESTNMKKRNILIAVFAVLAMAPLAKAEVPQINFDGVGPAVDVKAILRENPEFVAEIPKAQLQQGEFFSYLNEGVVNGVIQGAIESCAAERKEAVMIDLKNLLKYGTIKEKAAFVYNKRGTYSFPAGITARHFDTSDGEVSGNKSRDSLNLTCNSWTTVQVCTNRQVCRIACAAAAGAAGAAAGGSIGAGAAIGASGQICQELCENVKECSDVRECASWSSTAGTGTDSHGNYRGRGVGF